MFLVMHVKWPQNSLEKFGSGLKSLCRECEVKYVQKIVLSTFYFNFLLYLISGWKYCHVLPGNMTNNLWVLDLIPQFTGYSPGGITVNYNTFNNA
jgi:hypothetical protein